jgi:uncharacterized protein YbjQ (UPF0145 family)
MLITGLSGNEIFCLAQKGWAPGGVVVGNSVYSLGFTRSITSSFQTLAGGEIASVTQLISDGRHAALKRMEDEAAEQNAHGMTGVTSDLRKLSNLVEFLAIGSAVKGADHTGPFFTTACTGQDLFCQMDAGFEPRHFVIGNVAYALGVGRGIMGALRTFAGGEVKEFSQMYNHTRHLALERLEKEAQERGANAVVDVITHVLPFGPGVKEMLMVGTASHHEALGKPDRPVTSELTGEELWNLSKLGYAPVRLVLGTSVYALGFSGGIATFFKSFSRGEVSNVTRLIYEARENALDLIRREARDLGADAVVGTKIYVHEIGSSFVEVLAIGTAIKKHSGMGTQSSQLLPQAIIRDRSTFFDNDHFASSATQALERK